VAGLARRDYAESISAGGNSYFQNKKTQAVLEKGHMLQFGASPYRFRSCYATGAKK
jgi:hypothetical protein